MGNLPLSRTITLDGTSAVPSTLLNELEDAVIGGWRSAFFGGAATAPIGQTGFTQQTLLALSGGAIGGPIWVATATLATLRYQIAITEGDTIGGIALDVFGTGQPITVISAVGSAAQMDSGTGLTTLCGETYTPAAGWQRTVWLPGAAHAFTGRRIANTDLAFFDVQINNHAGVKLAGVRPLLSRLP